MIFSELYSAYYNTVAQIIASIINGKRSESELQELVLEYAFGESILTILPSLKNEKWQLVHSDMSTSLKHIPTMPLTNLQKEWLKAISLDPRIKLFDIRLDGIDNVEPLFTQNDYYVYDKYSDGDPFEDEDYIRRFRMILSAIKEQRQIELKIENKENDINYVRCIPLNLEYSEKDDKFRVACISRGSIAKIELSKIMYCVVTSKSDNILTTTKEVQYDTLILKIIDERNTLERVMLHFAHYEKRAEKIDKSHYIVKIRYEHNDENEMIVRILSFGQLVEVIGSDSFKKMLIEKLNKQKNCGLK